MKRLVLSVLLGSSLLLGGCGGGEDAEAKEEISTYLMDQQEGQQMIDLEQEEADCISEGMVDGIGVDRLKEYNFLDEDGTVNENPTEPEMSNEDAETMVDAMFDCTDVMDTMQNELADSMGEQSPEVKECFDEALTEERVRALLVATFSGNQDAATQELTAPLMKCAMGGLTPPEE